MTCTLKRFDRKRIRKTLTACNQGTSPHRPALTQLFSPTGKYFILWKIIILVSSPFSVKEYAEWFEIRNIIFNSNGGLSSGIEKCFAGVGLDPLLSWLFWLHLLKFNYYIGRARCSNTQFSKSFWRLASKKKLLPCSKDTIQDETNAASYFCFVTIF